MRDYSRSPSCFGVRNVSNLQPQHTFDIEVRCHLHRFVCSVRSPSTRGTPVSPLCVMRYALCLLVKIMTMTTSISITFIFLVLQRKSGLGSAVTGKAKRNFASSCTYISKNSWNYRAYSEPGGKGVHRPILSNVAVELVAISALYSKDSRFKFRGEDHPYWLRLLMVFVRPFRQM
jgi:hypothetical protein